MKKIQLYSTDYTTVEIFIKLLEEGTPTLKRARAINLDNGTYKILAPPDYNPEDEIWEFEPDTIVIGCRIIDDTGEKLLLATRLPISKAEIIEKYPDMDIILINVISNINGKKIKKPMEAIDLKNGLYKLLPTGDYDPSREHWEFSPGSVVRAVQDKNTLLALDQIREDRMDGEYARYVLKNGSRPSPG